MVQEKLAELPSGMKVVVREFKVSDEDLLGDKKLIRKGTAITNLLRNITLSMSDSGPYDFDSTPRWEEVLQGDRQVALKEARVFTWGNEFEHQVSCPKCSSVTTLSLDIEDWPVQALPQESIDHVVSGKPLSCTLPRCEKLVRFRLLRGKDEKNLQKLSREKKETLMSSYLRYRITEIQDVKQPDWPKFIRDMSTYDSSFLRAEMDRQDCGLEQSVECICDDCSHGWIEEVTLGASFLFPKFRKKTT